MNEDVLIQGPENSPLLSNGTSDPVLPNEVLEGSLNDQPEEISNALPQSLLEIPEDFQTFSEDFSELQEFISNPFSTEEMNSPLENTFQELCFPLSMPLTP